MLRIREWPYLALFVVGNAIVTKHISATYRITNHHSARDASDPSNIPPPVSNTPPPLSLRDTPTTQPGLIPERRQTIYPSSGTTRPSISPCIIRHPRPLQPTARKIPSNPDRQDTWQGIHKIVIAPRPCQNRPTNVVRPAPQRDRPRHRRVPRRETAQLAPAQHTRAGAASDAAAPRAGARGPRRRAAAHRGCRARIRVSYAAAAGARRGGECAGSQIPV